MGARKVCQFRRFDGFGESLDMIVAGMNFQQHGGTLNHHSEIVEAGSIGGADF